MATTTKEVTTLHLIRSPRARLQLTANATQGVLPGKGQRPTPHAVRLANALMLEQMLHAGVFRDLNDAIRKLGISRGIVRRLLQMLNQPPDKMVEILNSRY